MPGTALLRRPWHVRAIQSGTTVHRRPSVSTVSGGIAAGHRPYAQVSNLACRRSQSCYVHTGSVADQRLRRFRRRCATRRATRLIGGRRAVLALCPRGRPLRSARGLVVHGGTPGARLRSRPPSRAAPVLSSGSRAQRPRPAASRQLLPGRTQGLRQRDDAVNLGCVNVFSG